MTETRSHPLALQLHSQKAIELLADKRTTQGAQQHKIFGFRTFCTLARTVWRKAYEDDPYAELVLIEIERRIQNACETLSQSSRDLDAMLGKHTRNSLLLSSIQAYSVSGQLSGGEFVNEPVVMHAHADLPHANMGSALLALYDLLIRKASVFRHFGIINGGTFHKCVKDGRTSIRGVFAVPCMYKDCNVTRDDIVHQTVEGIKAVEANGPVPEAILNRILLSKFRAGTHKAPPLAPGSNQGEDNL